MMAYPPRQYHEGFWYHVYARSLKEVRLFKSDEEREWFVQTLDEIFARRKVSLGALCLMDAHYHSLARMGPVSLDRVLNGLHMSYTKHINKTRNRQGPLFRERPGADIVLNDTYLLLLVPYIHTNPTEAGMVSYVSDYPRSTDGMYRADGEALYDWSCWRYPPCFEGKDRERVYRQRLGESVEGLDGVEQYKGYLGTEEEWEQLERRREPRSGHRIERRGRPSMREILKEIIDSDPADVTVEDCRAKGQTQPETRLRREAMVKMYEEGYGPKEIGDFFGRHKSTVNHSVKDAKNS